MLKLLVVAISLTAAVGGCTKKSGKLHESPTGNKTNEAATSSSPAISYQIPLLTDDNMTTCDGVSVTKDSDLANGLCQAEVVVTSVGPSMVLTVKDGKELYSPTVYIDLWKYEGPDLPTEGTVYQLISERDAKDGMLRVPDGTQDFAAAAYTPSDVFHKEQLQGAIVMTKMPKKSGDPYELHFHMLSLDGTKHLTGKVMGTATDSTLMKPDNG